MEHTENNALVRIHVELYKQTFNGTCSYEKSTQSSCKYFINVGMVYTPFAAPIITPVYISYSFHDFCATCRGTKR